MPDEGMALHHSMRLSGSIELRVAGSVAQLTGLDLDLEGDLDSPEASFRMTVKGPLAEVRKLGALGPAFRDLLARVEQEGADQRAELALDATRSLVADMARAVPSGAGMIQDAFDAEAWSTLAFALDRYEPRSVSIVTAL